jgi:acyl-[acyl-carrier-protein]-phospholipid O-acyltransferase/long-chain-fatty-acid--[acyl-carrier-protein] ligase
MHQVHSPATGGQTQSDDDDTQQRDSLRSMTFIGLLMTQFLGTTNDNILRWLVIGIGKHYVAPDHQSAVLAIGSGCLVLPYLLLAAPAGYLADRFSKRNVIFGCKIAEIVMMVAAIVVIKFGHVNLMFAIVALIGAQAALFGPAKLGSIPEMLRPDKISSANGVLGLATVIAATIGSALGNWLVVATGNPGMHWLWISAIVLIGIATAGWIASLLIVPLKAADP